MARIVNMTLRNNVVATYEGEVQDGKPQGFGSAYYRSGGRYEGEWKDGKRCGQGKGITDGTLRYEGEWQDGVRSGQGKSIIPMEPLLMKESGLMIDLKQPPSLLPSKYTLSLSSLCQLDRIH